MRSTNLLSAARHWWLTLLLAVVLAGAAGYLFSSEMPVPHEARVRMLVGPTVDDHDGQRAAGQMARTYGELVTSEDVIEGTITALGLALQPDQLRAAIQPTADSATRILIIRARDLDAERAALIANELASQLQRMGTAGDAGPASALLVIERASAGTPTGIPTAIIVGLAAFAGLVAAMTLVLLLENLNETVRGEEELVTLTGADYLGSVIPPERWNAPRGFVIESAPGSARAADYRMLATKTELIAQRDGVRSLLLLGVGGAHGAGALGANMAKVLAERRHCVTLVDANPATREITASLGLEDHLGLTDMMELDEFSSEEELHPGSFTFSSDPRLFVVPFGRAAGSVSPPTTGAPSILDRLLQQADFVLVNAAPADRSAASLVWAGAADATVLVVPRNRVKRVGLTHLVESLRLVGGNVIGVVFEEPRPLVATTARHVTAPRQPHPSPTADDGGSLAQPPKPAAERLARHRATASYPTDGDDSSPGGPP